MLLRDFTVICNSVFKILFQARFYFVLCQALEKMIWDVNVNTSKFILYLVTDFTYISCKPVTPVNVSHRLRRMYFNFLGWSLVVNGFPCWSNISKVLQPNVRCYLCLGFCLGFCLVRDTRAVTLLQFLGACQSQEKFLVFGKAIKLKKNQNCRDHKHPQDIRRMPFSVTFLKKHCNCASYVCRKTLQNAGFYICWQSFPLYSFDMLPSSRLEDSSSLSLVPFSPLRRLRDW